MRDGNVYDFKEKSKKGEITKKVNEWIQLLKDEGMCSNLEEYLVTLSKNSFEEEEEN